MARLETPQLAALLIAAAALSAAVFLNNPFTQPGSPAPSPTPFFSPSPSPSSPPAPSPSQEASPGESAPPSPDDILVLELSPDKSAYYPQEDMTVRVRVGAARPLSRVDLSVYGVTSARGYDYVESRRPVSLSEGENEFNFSFTLPSCSPCSGVAFGEHNLTASLYFNGRLLKTATSTIALNPTPAPAP